MFNYLRLKTVKYIVNWCNIFLLISNPSRRYAGLYFCVCVDVNDNNLAYLEAIHNFVEVLNEYFHNVCELDLVFNFYKVIISVISLWVPLLILIITITIIDISQLKIVNRYQLKMHRIASFHGIIIVSVIIIINIITYFVIIITSNNNYSMVYITGVQRRGWDVPRWRDPGDK